MPDGSRPGSANEVPSPASITAPVAFPVNAAMMNPFRFLSCAFALCAAFAQADPLPVQSVDRVDLARYVGKWYEIAAFPMFFQRQCVGDTTAEYALRSDGDIAVVNRCRTETGFDEAVGKAWVVDGTGNAQLKVSFFWPFRADYWVVGLDRDYRWAVVGNPNRKYLWVLARTPRLPRDQLDDALRAAASQGFDLGQLKYTMQGDASGSAGAAPP
jgi:apolipoprotein D and lipocalin family protein